MKARRIKLAACLLAGAIIFSTGAAPAMAAEKQSDSDTLMAGFSLALAEMETETEDELSQELREEAEKAAREQEEARQEEEEAYAGMGVAVVSDYLTVGDRELIDAAGVRMAEVCTGTSAQASRKVEKRQIIWKHIPEL